MDLYDELPEPPRGPGEKASESSPSESTPTHVNAAGKRRAETIDTGSCDGRHREKKVCKGAAVLAALKQDFTYVYKPFAPSKHTEFHGLISLKAHVAERRGEREELQDAHTICDLSQDCQPMPADMIPRELCTIDSRRKLESCLKCHAL